MPHSSSVSELEERARIAVARGLNGSAHEKKSDEPDASNIDNAPKPLPVVWYKDLGEVKHQDEIVKGLLVVGSLVVIFGESNSGKTFFALDLVLAVAGGMEWRGRRTSRGLVIYVAGEGAASVKARVAAYRMEKPEVPENIAFAIISQAVDFLSIASVASLIEAIKAAGIQSNQKPAIVVIDTFARALAGGDENSAQDVGHAVGLADLIRTETGACVIFVHHAGKDPSKGARGSSALRAATDTEILIEGQSGQRTATVTKQRDLMTGEAMPFDLLAVKIAIDPVDRTAITSCIVKHLDSTTITAPRLKELTGKVQRQIIAALRRKADPAHIWTPPEMRELAREIGITHKSTIQDAVDTVVTSGYMVKVGWGYRFTDGEPQV